VRPLLHRRLRTRRRAVPHPDVHDQDAPFVFLQMAPAIEAPRDDAAVDFVEMTPLVERMRVAFFA
jgi:hypothetical protein